MKIFKVFSTSLSPNEIKPLPFQKLANYQVKGKAKAKGEEREWPMATLYWPDVNPHRTPRKRVYAEFDIRPQCMVGLPKWATKANADSA